MIHTHHAKFAFSLAFSLSLSFSILSSFIEFAVDIHWLWKTLLFYCWLKLNLKEYECSIPCPEYRFIQTKISQSWKYWIIYWLSGISHFVAGHSDCNINYYFSTHNASIKKIRHFRMTQCRDMWICGTFCRKIHFT